MSTSKPVRPVRLAAAVVSRPPPSGAAREAEAATAAGARLTLTFENPGSEPLHVWSSTRALAYSAADGLLTLYLTEQTPPPPPGITMISQHPRPPRQVVVAGRGSASFDVTLPPTVRRRVEGTGLGLHFVEEPIGEVRRVEVHVQYATEEVAPLKDETPEAFTARLRRHGSVEHTAITTSQE